MTNNIENEHTNTPSQLFVSTVIDLWIGLLGDLVTVRVELDRGQCLGENVCCIPVTFDILNVYHGSPQKVADLMVLHVNVFRAL